ncbi:hypothetical protein EXIGLDRAFT_721773 [Exidia glandulosa HHB12029]|uniref:P-loop containing nucleoside triphosphate hydrolase protein n=1 Tax=Exidia glandulosa HHB12029 TaxID=1314781 RepID=A0A165QG44_EXIGL|nr:hypothetical protein EXIGLDRAFT_721773 [Exidia glandulosa HHB12029]
MGLVNCEPGDLACTMNAAFGLFVPVAAVASGFVGVALSKTKLFSHDGVLGVFITREDEEEDELLDNDDDKPQAKPADDDAEPSRHQDADVDEATPLLANGTQKKTTTKTDGRSAASIVLVLVALVELCTRFAFYIRAGVSGDAKWADAPSIITLLVWAYATILPLVSPPQTPPYTILLIYTSTLLASIVDLYISLVDPEVANLGPWRWSLFLQLAHPGLCLLAVLVILQMPMRVTRTEPTKNAEGLHPALDDWSTLGQWATFSWLSPLIALGTKTALEEPDVWQLARNLRSRLLLRNFERVAPGRSLMIRLFAANGRDLLVTGLLTLGSTCLQLAQPVLLSKILIAMEDSERESSDPLGFHHLVALVMNPVPALHIVASDLGLGSSDDAVVAAAAAGRNGRQTAYLWTALAFLAMLSKAELDLQGFYMGRRTTLRAKSETIASIYQKALKRIDTSGAVGVNAKAAPKGDAKDKDAKKDGKKEEKKEEAKVQTAGSADLGKITSLVSTDANRIGFFMNFYTQIIQTPLSIFLAASFLYRLMGWSAFAGYAALIIATPANHFLMKMQYKAVMQVMEMRDRRMRSMNEVIQAIKFIKFSAWETRWGDRVLTHRDRELKQVMKLKIIMFFINFVWDVVPIIVACVSLTTFTWVAGRELSVSIAFPALLTFQILTDELTSLPLVANLLQRMYASVVRIGDFLEEEEVPVWVSALLHEEGPAADAQVFDERIGCEGATFVWNTTAVKPEKLLAEELKKKAEEDKQANRRSWVQLLTLRKKPAARPSILPDTASGTTAATSTAVEGGSASATPSTPKQEFALRDLSVVFPRSKMSLIYGPTGSGKSSLLSAILGEMKCVEGRVYLPKFPTRIDPESGMKESISFCAQQPWLEHATIRENILFGTPYDKQRYESVLSACALLPDLKILEDGDKTEIGEKGISLSGGQKARVALARAIYAYSKTVILDDVLSAVDTHTASVLIKRCFLGPLMKGRTLILITHHVDSVIQHCSYVARMNNGIIEAQGTPQELLAQGELTPEQVGQGSGVKDEDFEPEAEEAESAEGAGKTDEDKAAKKLVDKETKASGAVKRKIYLTYLKAAGYWIVAVLFLTILLQRGSDLAQKLWVKSWSESYESATPRRTPPFGFPTPTQNPLPYVAVYVSIQAFNALTSIASQIPNIWSSLRASRKLYTSMLDSVLRSPSRWFDKTPAGRILNRFAKDIDTVDTGLSFYVQMVGDQLISFTISIGFIAYGVPPFLIAAIFLGYLHYYVANGYIKTSRDLNRLESTLRSPIISAFGELLVGVATVRAFGDEKRFMRALFTRLDKCQAAFYYTWMTNFWLRFRFGILGSLTFLFTAMLALSIGLTPGLAAIVITQAQGVLGTIYWGMRAYVEAEQAFNGIERISEYIELPPEPPRIAEKRPPQNWPTEQGGIEFDDVVIKYAPDLDPVLKNLSFKITAKEKIGLVGRTGSGKSTMALSLFRFVDPTQGKIAIDDVDITSIGVEDLRSRLTLIPQDAVLFKGTIRENLDPFNEYTDEQCLEVLRSVQLPVDEPEESAVPSPNATIASGSSTPRPDAGSKIIVKLESQVSEGGNNWSAGQRQLIAMARALLRKTRITVLDESTASVDFETDKKIQNTIRDGFKESIMIIIAHRLHTIIECDRILVLDAGQVVEFDTPASLIDKEGGVFRSMCEKSDSFDALSAAAHKKASES